MPFKECGVFQIKKDDCYSEVESLESGESFWFYKEDGGIDSVIFMTLLKEDEDCYYVVIEK